MLPPTSRVRCPGTVLSGVDDQGRDVLALQPERQRAHTHRGSMNRQALRTVLVVEPPPASGTPETSGVASHAGPTGPGVDCRRAGTPAGNFVAPAEAPSVPVHGQPTAEAIGRPQDPRD